MPEASDGRQGCGMWKQAQGQGLEALESQQGPGASSSYLHQDGIPTYQLVEGRGLLRSRDDERQEVDRPSASAAKFPSVPTRPGVMTADRQAGAGGWRSGRLP